MKNYDRREKTFNDKNNIYIKVNDAYIPVEEVTANELNIRNKLTIFNRGRKMKETARRGRRMTMLDRLLNNSRIYLCTECHQKKYKEQVHIQYGFVPRYTTNRYYGNQRTVYFKVLCICKKCLINIATKRLMLHRKRERQLRKQQERINNQKEN